MYAKSCVVPSSKCDSDTASVILRFASLRPFVGVALHVRSSRYQWVAGIRVGWACMIAVRPSVEKLALLGQFDSQEVLQSSSVFLVSIVDLSASTILFEVKQRWRDVDPEH